MPEQIVKKWDGPYSFMVFREYGVYKARRGDTAEIQFQDPKLHEVLNDVWNALTPGRTWKEKVVLKGSFELPEAIKIPNYVTLDLRQAHLKAVANKDYGNDFFLVTNEDHTYGNIGIEVIGGVIDGNRDNAAKCGGVRFKGDATQGYYCDRIRLEDIYIKNCYYHGWEIHSGRDCQIRGMISENCGGDGLYHGWKCTRGERYAVSDIISIDSGASGGKPNVVYRSTFTNLISINAGLDGFEIGDDHECAFSNIVSVNSSRYGFRVITGTELSIHGFYVYGAGADVYGVMVKGDCENVHLKNGVIDYCSGEGLWIDGDKNTVEAVTVRYCGDYGVRISFTAKNIILSNMQVWNNAGRGVHFEAIDGYVKLVNSIIDDDQETPTQDIAIRFSGGTGTVYLCNNKLGGTWPISGTLPSKVIFRDNEGYVTESSGTATGTGAQQAIAHGCDFTPTKAQVIVSNIDDGANPYLSADPDATYIYVTAVSGKEYRWEVKRAP